MLNIVALMGRICADPEQRVTPSGVATCTFNIAVDRSFCKTGEERKADFITIVAWRQTAEFVCKHFHKGSLIAVDGALQSRNYDDKNGNKRTAYEVVANNINFTGEKKSDAPQSKFTTAKNAADIEPDTFSDIDDNPDLPF